MKYDVKRLSYIAALVEQCVTIMRSCQNTETYTLISIKRKGIEEKDEFFVTGPFVHKAFLFLFERVITKNENFRLIRKRLHLRTKRGRFHRGLR